MVGGIGCPGGENREREREREDTLERIVSSGSRRTGKKTREQENTFGWKKIGGMSSVRSEGPNETNEANDNLPTITTANSFLRSRDYYSDKYFRTDGVLLLLQVLE